MIISPYISLLKVLTYRQLAKDPSQLPRGPVMCLQHPTIPYTLYCLKCDKIICTQCEIDSHSDFCHDISAADEKLCQIFKNELEEIVKNVSGKVLEFFLSFSEK